VDDGQPFIVAAPRFSARVAGTIRNANRGQVVLLDPTVQRVIWAVQHDYLRPLTD